MNTIMYDSQDSNSRPVTVIIKRIARKNKIKEFEQWLSGIIQDIAGFQGYMGVDVIRPSDFSNPEYVIIFRFNNYDNLKKWENSPVRNRWLEQGRKLVEIDPDVQKLTGVEIWFTPKSKQNEVNSQPPRYKMAFVIIVVISVLLTTLIPQIDLVTEMLLIPDPIRLVIGIVITVLLMTYLIMPALTKLLKPWLYKKSLL